MTSTQTEPSMEEILASIRRIIAEDDDDQPAPAAARPSSPASAPATMARDDGFALSAAADRDVDASSDDDNFIDADSYAPSREAPAPRASATRAPEPVAPTVNSSPVTRPPLRTETPRADASRPDASKTGGSTSQKPASAAESRHSVGSSADRVVDYAQNPAARSQGRTHQEEDQSMLAEASAAAATKAFQNLSSSVRESTTESRTLEAIVVEMLNPLIKDWLDANLPAIVEEKVEEEIRRVARRARG